MAIIEDQPGRYEIGFPRRAWPKEIESPEVSLPEFNKNGPRFVNDDDIALIQLYYHGKYPIYRSVYKFNKFDTRPGKFYGLPDKESAIVDKLFLEVECQPCGKLCGHTIRETRNLDVYFKQAGVIPHIYFSTNKSLHFYADCDKPVDIPNKNQTLKYVTRYIRNNSKCWLIDKRAMLGVRQLSRLLGAQNPKTKLYVTPLTSEELWYVNADDIRRKAKEPAYDVPEPPKNPALTEALKGASERAAQKQIEIKNTVQVDTSSCKTISDLLSTGVGTGRRHYARVAIIKWLMSNGASQKEIEDVVLSFNEQCKPQDDYDDVMNDIHGNIHSDDTIPHCYFLYESFGKNCSDCFWRKSALPKLQFETKKD